MDTIYHYDGVTGLLLSQSMADYNQLAPEHPLLPAYATPTPPLNPGEFECVRYLTPSGHAPAHHADGSWIIQPDWREARLWSMADGREIQITDPNVTPADKNATVVPYPGPGHVWRDEQWQADTELQYQLAEDAAEKELASRKAKASSEIARIQPAVDGGYAKPEDVERFPKWQRYLYELPDVRTKPGWPEKPQWPAEPDKVI
ncbi:tail fiber assembly protein [Aeromonas hydrophila]|uniref:tail fiber assembly protein n=1 Tax=Aeromonas hydrophila TaxID=644 RepID=UPI00249ECD53|nr:tail fiber assembly protein [Aeromonas hydrophila]WGY33712.1 tail fiber assembly protein [Aeromonas hydrophila]HDC4321630.1 tail fiber assembly protein [Aeromonas hydrophila]